MADTAYLEKLYAEKPDAIDAAVALADLNGAPVRVVYSAITRYYSLSEDPGGPEPWPWWLTDVAVVDPTEVSR